MPASAPCRERHGVRDDGRQHLSWRSSEELTAASPRASACSSSVRGPRLRACQISCASSRAFSIAITAWSANVFRSDDLGASGAARARSGDGDDADDIISPGASAPRRVDRNPRSLAWESDVPSPRRSPSRVSEHVLDRFCEEGARRGKVCQRGTPGRAMARHERGRCSLAFLPAPQPALIRAPSYRNTAADHASNSRMAL